MIKNTKKKTIKTRVLTTDEWVSLDTAMKKFIDEMIEVEDPRFIVGYLSSMLVNVVAAADTQDEIIARIQRGYHDRYR